VQEVEEDLRLVVGSVAQANREEPA
jgi:hypothetical protein